MSFLRGLDHITDLCLSALQMNTYFTLRDLCFINGGLLNHKFGDY